MTKQAPELQSTKRKRVLSQAVGLLVPVVEMRQRIEFGRGPLDVMIGLALRVHDKMRERLAIRAMLVVAGTVCVGAGLIVASALKPLFGL